MQLYVITTKGNSIVRKTGNSSVNKKNNVLGNVNWKENPKKITDATIPITYIYFLKGNVMYNYNTLHTYTRTNTETDITDSLVYHCPSCKCKRYYYVMKADTDLFNEYMPPTHVTLAFEGFSLGWPSSADGRLFGGLMESTYDCV